MTNYISYFYRTQKSKPRIKRWVGRDHRGLPKIRLILGQNVYIKKNHVKCKDIIPHRIRSRRPTNKTLHTRKEYKKYWIAFKEFYFKMVMGILDYFEFERDFFRRVMYREWYHHTFLNNLTHGMIHMAFWFPFIVIYLILKKVLKLSRKYKPQSLSIYISVCFIYYYTFDIEKYPLIKEFFIIIEEDPVLSSIWN
jgi:hypothetical protein